MKLEPATREEIIAAAEKAKGQYDKLLDEFMESDMIVAKIDGEGKTFMTMRIGFHNALRKNINIPAHLVEVGDELFLVKKV
jgi:hypothetical protein